ncbi:hypothetical protein evm_003469 [Chilo suppressalis]|nr:hypothetical protein evm_003469 [Chilo suppressalis]
MDTYVIKYNLLLTRASEFDLDGANMDHGTISHIPQTHQAACHEMQHLQGCLPAEHDANVQQERVKPGGFGPAEFELQLMSINIAIRIIGDEEVTKHLNLKPLQLRRDVASLSAFYRLYHGECSEELFFLIPPSPFL